MRKFLLLIPFFLVACASSRFESGFSPVYVTNTSKYMLLPASEIESPIDTLERMEADFGGQHLEADLYVISDENQLSVTVFNEFGATMASLLYDGSTLDFESEFFPKKIKAEYIVADFQFALYNADSIKSALEKIDVDFELSSEQNLNERTETRILSKKGKIISKITKTYSCTENENREKLLSIHYENFLRGYSYLLTLL